MGRQTKADRNGHSDTPPRELAPEQEIALAALIGGATDAEAAEQAGCTRQTVNQWRNHDAVFMARMNAERKALWASSTDQLRGLVREAVQVLADNLHSDDAKAKQAAAVHILRCVGIYGADLAPTGEITPGAIEADWRRAELFNITF